MKERPMEQLPLIVPDCFLLIFNNNVTIQWLHYTYGSSSSSGKEFTWPIAFKTAVRGMTKNVASSSTDSPDYYEAFTWSNSKTKFTTGYHGNYGDQFWVMGIGY